MRISENSIDLIKTAEAFCSRHDAKPVSRERFGRHIVEVTHGTIGRYSVSPILLPGIQKCLTEMTGRLKWRNHVWIIPVGPIQGLSGFRKSEELKLLVDSLLMTMITYQKPLWEFETNLAQILLTDLIFGFERVCAWIERGVSIDMEKNELIIPIGQEKVSAIENMVRNAITV